MKDQYNQAVETLKILGFYPIPSLGQIEGLFTKKQLDYIDKHKATLVLTPPTSLKEIIKKFDKGQKDNTYVYTTLWDQYDISLANWRVDFVLSELFFTSQTYQDQKKSLAKTKKSIAGLQSINPLTYIVLQATSKPHYLDAKTWTRFIQYDMKNAGGDSWVPSADSGVSRLKLAGSYGHADSFVGVRLSVGAEISGFELSISSAAPLPSKFDESAKILKKLLDEQYKQGWNDAIGLTVENLPEKK